jgi:hypothetical protein
MKISPNEILMLRTCSKDMTSHGGFLWPKSGPVECDDWNPNPVCGGGLHGLPWGGGDWSLLDEQNNPVYVVFAAPESDVVAIDDKKSKCRRANVVGCFDNWWEAMAVIRAERRNRFPANSNM